MDQKPNLIVTKTFNFSKEARETRYWLRLLDQTSLTEKGIKHLLKEVEEIINILTKIIKTSSGK